MRISTTELTVSGRMLREGLVTRFFYLTCKSKYQGDKVCHKEKVFLKAAETGELVSNLPPRRQGAWLFMRHSIKQQVWDMEGMGTIGKRDWKKVLSSWFCAGVTKLQVSAPLQMKVLDTIEGGVFGLLMSKVTEWTLTYSVGGSVVLSSLNQLSLN